MSIVQKLTEGMVNRNMQQEGAALLRKWSQTGLLEGLSGEEQKASMARLLENQARELLRESNTMSGGDVEGFAAVAFPIVRRVFAGLIANDLVSVQPMSLPSGLIFFLDFKFSDTNPASARLGLGGASSNDSIYGQGVVGSAVTGGVKLNSLTLDQQPYAFGSAYSSPTGSESAPAGAVGKWAGFDPTAATGDYVNAENEDLSKDIKFDADIAEGTYILTVNVTKAALEATTGQKINMDLLSQIIAPVATALDSSAATVLSGGKTLTQVRRLTSFDGTYFTFVYAASAQLDAEVATVTMGECSFPILDQFKAQGGLGAIAGTAKWGLEDNGNIPEIDIKVDSIAITATTKKLKAKWTPELGQDLNAYHNLDAEVELTSILSEQIALEIDREIMSDLVNGATAGTYYWSRSPGMFVDRLTGRALGAQSVAPDFTGTVSEWYETLIETINDVSAQIHRKTLRGGANFVVLSPEVANILEFTAGFRANVTADADKGDIGAVKVGSLNRKFDVIVDPYFPRNAILVGRKGSSFLESGYVYAPYVPLQTTPTIFGTDDFVPRKGVMTRYGKKMVRPDMYGLVIVRGLLGNDEITAP